MGGHVNPRSNHEVTLLGDIYIWGALELKAMVGQLCLDNYCVAHLIGHEIHHKSCVICSFTLLHLFMAPS